MAPLSVRWRFPGVRFPTLRNTREDEGEAAAGRLAAEDADADADVAVDDSVDGSNVVEVDEDLAGVGPGERAGAGLEPETEPARVGNEAADDDAAIAAIAAFVASRCGRWRLDGFPMLPSHAAIVVASWVAGPHC